MQFSVSADILSMTKKEQASHREMMQAQTRRLAVWHYRQAKAYATVQLNSRQTLRSRCPSWLMRFWDAGVFRPESAAAQRQTSTQKSALQPGLILGRCTP